MADYQETFAELQNLLASLERDTVSIDELSERLSTGFALIESLRAKLTAVEAKVDEIINARGSSSSEKAGAEPHEG